MCVFKVRQVTKRLGCRQVVSCILTIRAAFIVAEAACSGTVYSPTCHVGRTRADTIQAMATAHGSSRYAKRKRKRGMIVYLLCSLLLLLLFVCALLGFTHHWLMMCQTERERGEVRTKSKIKEQLQ